MNKIKSVILLFILMIMNVGCITIKEEVSFTFFDVLGYSINDIKTVHYDNGFYEDNSFLVFENDYESILNVEYKESNISLESFSKFIEDYTLCIILNKYTENDDLFYFVNSKFYINKNEKIYETKKEYIEKHINPIFHKNHKDYFESEPIEVYQSTCKEHGYAKKKCLYCKQIIIDEFPLVPCVYENDNCKWCNNKKINYKITYTHTYEDSKCKTKIINSIEELEKYYNDNKDNESYHFDKSYYFNQPSFKEVMQSYTDEYFNSKSLIIFEAESFSSSVDLYINSIYKDNHNNNLLTIDFMMVRPSFCNCDLNGYHFFIELDYKIEYGGISINFIDILLKEYQKY